MYKLHKKKIIQKYLVSVIVQKPFAENILTTFSHFSVC